MQVAKAGRMVNFVMKDGSVRPLIITATFNTTDDPAKAMVNGHLLLDGSNDRENNPYIEKPDPEKDAPMTQWVTSAHHDFDKAVGTWHWPERT